MRMQFGGGPEDVFLVPDADGDLHQAGGVLLRCYATETGNSPLTDLRTLDGVPIAYVTTSTGSDGRVAGQIAPFLGPDGIYEMWVGADGQARFLLQASNLGSVLGAANDTLAQHLAETNGHSTRLSDLLDVELGGAVVPTDGQALVYNATSDRWTPGDAVGGGGGGGSLAALSDIDPAAVAAATIGGPLVKGPAGLWIAGAGVTSYTMTGATTIAAPTGTLYDGRRCLVHAYASGADRVATFGTGFRTSDKVTSLAITVPSGQMLFAEAEYSTALSAWVMLRTALTTGAGVLSAGADATLTTAQTFTRTASEPAGATVTARKWEIISGPLGTGMTIGTAAALSWKPGSSVAGSNDIRNPTFQEIAFELTSTAENSTTDWTTAYGYIEDINDNRGYTAGLVGFTSGTGDMLLLVQQYATEKPSNNVLAPYLSGLQQCANVGFGSGASAAAASNLGQGFINAWQSAATNDPIFRKVQRDFRKSMYWDDALTQALADGVGPLGLAIYYDVLVNHGVGNDSESFGGILSYVRANNTKPSSGGNMTTWLNAITDRRDTILDGWGDTQQSVDGRVWFHRLLINGGTLNGVAQSANLNLVAPIKWACYGDPFTINARPDPAPDALLGSYLLRYTATGAGTDDVTVTVI